MGDKMIKRAFAFLTVLALALLGGIGGSTAAFADDSVNKGRPKVTGPNGLRTGAIGQGTGADCPSGLFCIWVDSNYNGARYQISWQSLIGNPGNGIQLTWIAGIGSSFYNRTPYPIRIHDHENCGNLGWSREMLAGTKLNAAGTPVVNDRITALQLGSAYPNYCA